MHQFVNSNIVFISFHFHVFVHQFFAISFNSINRSTLTRFCSYFILNDLELHSTINYTSCQCHESSSISNHQKMSFSSSYNWQIWMGGDNYCYA